MLGNKRGLTFIELIIVVAIIGVLTTLSITSYSVYLERGRKINAKKTMSNIVAVAKAFRRNTGFYLPSLKNMHIRFEGEYYFNHRIFCASGGSIISNHTSTCGAFTLASKKGTCWKGYVLYHSFSKEGETGYDGSEPIACGGADITYNQDYRPPNRFRGVYSFGEPADANTAAVTAKFKIHDIANADCATTVRPDKFRSRKCTLLPSYALKSATGSAEASIITKIKTATGQKNKDFVSSPNRLTVNAFGCTSKAEDGKCDGTGDTGQKYNFLRFDSRRILFEHQGTL